MLSAPQGISLPLCAPPNSGSTGHPQNQTPHIKAFCRLSEVNTRAESQMLFLLQPMLFPLNCTVLYNNFNYMKSTTNVNVKWTERFSSKQWKLHASEVHFKNILKSLWIAKAICSTSSVWFPCVYENSPYFVTNQQNHHFFTSPAYFRVLLSALATDQDKICCLLISVGTLLLVSLELSFEAKHL